MEEQFNQLIVLLEGIKFYLMLNTLVLMIGVGFYIGYKVANR
jgi:hypothetical protein